MRLAGENADKKAAVVAGCMLLRFGEIEDTRLETVENVSVLLAVVR